MGITALVMAGGRGTRMKLDEEKPLIQVGGKTMIEYVIDALKKARKVDEIVIAVSKHTPETAEKMRKLSFRVLETPGEGYVPDIQYAVKKLKLGKFLSISADLPLITSDLIDDVLGSYARSGKPALTVMASAEFCKRIGIEPKYQFKYKGRIVTPIGINVLDGDKIDEPKIEEEVLILENEEFIINVNTIEDLKILKSDRSV